MGDEPAGFVLVVQAWRSDEEGVVMGSSPASPEKREW